MDIVLYVNWNPQIIYPILIYIYRGATVVLLPKFKRLEAGGQLGACGCIDPSHVVLPQN